MSVDGTPSSSEVQIFFIPMFEVDFDKSKSIIVNSLSQGSIPFIQFIRKENGL